MYNGSDEPEMELTPRNLTLIPPAGSPEFCVICAPGTLPCKEAMALGEPALFTWLPFTVPIKLPNCFLVVPCEVPVTTTSSSPVASSFKLASKLKLPVVLVMVNVFSADLNPTEEITTSYFPAFKLAIN